MKAPVVKIINEHAIIERLEKAGDEETLNYIRALKEASKGWERLFYDVKKKLNDITKGDWGT